MQHTVDYRLLERFRESRRTNRPPVDEPLRWLEQLRLRREREEHAEAVLPVRALDLRD